MIEDDVAIAARSGSWHVVSESFRGWRPQCVAHEQCCWGLAASVNVDTIPTGFWGALTMLESASSTAATRLLFSLARCLYARLAQRKVWRRQVPGLGVGVGAGAGLCLGADTEPDQPSQGAETSNSCLANSAQYIVLPSD